MENSFEMVTFDADNSVESTPDYTLNDHDLSEQITDFQHINLNPKPLLPDIVLLESKPIRHRADALKETLWSDDDSNHNVHDIGIQCCMSSSLPDEESWCLDVQVLKCLAPDVAPQLKINSPIVEDLSLPGTHFQVIGADSIRNSTRACSTPPRQHDLNKHFRLKRRPQRKHKNYSKSVSAEEIQAELLRIEFATRKYYFNDLVRSNKTFELRMILREQRSTSPTSLLNTRTV